MVLAVTGLGGPAFSLGPCRFFEVGKAEFDLWGRREFSGRYDPPPGTPSPLDNRPFEAILGNWAAAVRVRAVDAKHAVAKARFRLEEVLNVIRFVGFRFVSPCNCPRTGLGRPNFLSDSSLAMRIDPIGGFARTVGSGGVTSLETCRLSPAWAALTALVGKEDSDRTDLEKTVAVALEWVGQAAAAPLTPVRLVSLVTALEVLVIDRHESLGKRSKLSHRVGRIVSACYLDGGDHTSAASELYRVRSECLHEGVTQVEDGVVNTAYDFVTAVVLAYLTTEPYRNCLDLSAVLALDEPECELSYEI